MLMTTILICLVAAFGYLNSFFGSGNIGRPLVMSTLTGLVLGDMQLGIMTGATLELVWLGAFPIGASNPPDYTSGAILGTCYVILSGADPASAVLLANGEIADYGDFVKTLQDEDACITYRASNDTHEIYNEVYRKFVKLYPHLRGL